ncbi:4-methyl-5(B-hydroxyethyl)-thiazole monophosphate biosynthesis protein [Paenibacillus anaericanus]|uniref:4-methyl-5(B-hydroxyethyl)-thiazole monophosphate biosynthesis protein n=1 Tax=Paenibacillus anaericanus TaxID=170367 RepID=A0A433Y9K2_9BACL|nr:DJ-1/PfpI family protein [Paenibacillus anaericanus]RUT46585.1 4-methyl-5(B-hydroxyethyl)-thiazole monophosphate biosynthesis protein [Paenibacillus anaericanus]
MKSTGVFLYPLFSEYELTVALSILKQGNHPITTIGITSGPIQGESDLICIPDRTIYNTDISTLDSVLFPGCMDITTLYGNNDLIEFIRKCTSSKELVVAAISSSPYLLAKAGVLKDRKFTIGMEYEQRKITGIFDEENYCSELVVQDRNILTARGSGFIQFGIKLGELLELEFDPKWYQGQS